MHSSLYRYESQPLQKNTTKKKKIFSSLISSLPLIAAVTICTPALASKEPFTPTKPSSWKAAAEAKADGDDAAERRSEPETRRRLSSRRSAAASRARAAAKTRTSKTRTAKPATAENADAGTRTAKAEPARTPAANRTRQRTARAGGERNHSCGRASWYASGSRTANGERFVPSGLTAAHRTMAFGTRLLVIDPATNRSVTVRVNDRGPFIGGRILDLSRGAAAQLGVIGRGVAHVCVKVVEKTETASN